MRAMPTPAIEPSSPAFGTTRWMAPPTKAMPSLNRPIRNMHGHADLPGLDGGLVLGQPRLRGHEGGAEHREGHADGGRRVEAERHRGHVVAALAPRQPERHPRVDEVAEEHAQRGAGEHPRVDDVRGERRTRR